MNQYVEKAHVHQIQLLTAEKDQFATWWKNLSEHCKELGDEIGALKGQLFVMRDRLRELERENSQLKRRRVM